MYIGSAFDTSLGIDGAWVHSYPTGCTAKLHATISSDKTALDLTLIAMFP